MAKPRIIVVAGPPGSGKSLIFSVDRFSVDHFNVDVAARALNGGSYVSIPPATRARAQQQCRDFIGLHLRTRRSFAVETSLRDGAAIGTCREAKAAGFSSLLIYMATDSPEENIFRIKRRAKGQGHSAPPDVLRKSYRDSLSHLKEAVSVFDQSLIYDNTKRYRFRRLVSPKFLVMFVAGKLFYRPTEHLPSWVTTCLSL